MEVMLGPSMQGWKGGREELGEELLLMVRPCLQPCLQQRFPVQPRRAHIYLQHATIHSLIHRYCKCDIVIAN